MGLFDRFRSGSSAELRQKIEELRKRLKANPGSLTVALALADALHESGATREGVKLLAELGPVLQKKGQYLGAIAAYKKIAELEPAASSPEAAAARAELKRLEAAASTKSLQAVAPKSGASAEGADAQQKREEIHPLLASTSSSRRSTCGRSTPARSSSRKARPAPRCSSSSPARSRSPAVTRPAPTCRSGSWARATWLARSPSSRRCRGAPR